MAPRLQTFGLRTRQRVHVCGTCHGGPQRPTPLPYCCGKKELEAPRGPHPSLSSIDRDATPGGAFEAGTYRGLAGMVSAGAGRGLLQRHKLGEQPPGAQAGLGGIQLPLA